MPQSTVTIPSGACSSRTRCRRLGPQPVAVPEAVRNERDRVGPEPLQRRRQDGERADPVAVVVAEDDDTSAASRGPGEERDGLGHSAHPERIVEPSGPGLEPGPRLLGRGDPAGREDARQRGRHPERRARAGPRRPGRAAGGSARRGAAGRPGSPGRPRSPPRPPCDGTSRSGPRGGRRSGSVASRSRWRTRARPTASIVATGSECAPPGGSGITSSTTPRALQSAAVTRIASAASRAFAWSFQRIAAHPSGEMTE